VIASVAGDYSQAQAFCSPGSMLLATGNASTTVIQTVSLPGGALSVGHTLEGGFNSWFIDGSAFLTNSGNAVWIYSSSGQSLDAALLPAVKGLAGEGSWYWAYGCASSSSSSLNLAIYRVGSAGAAAASYSVPSDSLCQVPVTGSAMTVGVPDLVNSIMHVIDLSGEVPVHAQYPIPRIEVTGYAAASTSRWVLSDYHGVLLDGASLGGKPRFFSYGKAWSIAGSGPRLVVATASGQTLIFDTTTWNLEQTLDLSSSQMALSSDGTVLAARGSADQAPTSSLDASVRVYSLPSGSLISSWPYTLYSTPLNSGPPSPWAVDISLSASGKLLGQVIYSGGASNTYTRQVTASSGGPILWSDTLSGVPALYNLPALWTLPIRISDDDALIAVSSSKDVNATTNVYLNDALATSVPGWAVGWLPGKSILANLYTYNSEGPGATQYSGSAAYTSSGLKQSAPSVDMGESGTIQVIGPDSVFDPGANIEGARANTIYSLSTGAVTWSATGSPQYPGAVAGSSIVFELGSQVVMQRY
jgi:hypothetical protein